MSLGGIADVLFRYELSQQHTHVLRSRSIGLIRSDALPNIISQVRERLWDNYNVSGAEVADFEDSGLAVHLHVTYKDQPISSGSDGDGADFDQIRNSLEETLSHLTHRYHLCGIFITGKPVRSGCHQPHPAESRELATV